jgi:hypothetical protein
MQTRCGNSFLKWEVIRFPNEERMDDEWMKNEWMKREWMMNEWRMNEEWMNDERMDDEKDATYFSSYVWPPRAERAIFL